MLQSRALKRLPPSPRTAPSCVARLPWHPSLFITAPGYPHGYRPRVRASHGAAAEPGAVVLQQISCVRLVGVPAVTLTVCPQCSSTHFIPTVLAPS